MRVLTSASQGDIGPTRSAFANCVTITTAATVLAAPLYALLSIQWTTVLSPPFYALLSIQWACPLPVGLTLRNLINKRKRVGERVSERDATT